MPNTSDITSVASNILLVGDAGTHKTFLAGSIPDNYIFDFDKGVAVLRDRAVEYDTFKDLARFGPGGSAYLATPWHNEQGLYTWGLGWDAFYKKFLEVVDRIEKKDPKIKAITFDSLTMMSFLAVNKILRDTNQPAPHQGTWGAHHEYFKAIFSMATALPVRIVATAHVQRTDNDLTTNVEKLPLLAGKLAGLIGVFFDEVWYCDTKRNASGKAEFSIVTATDGTFRQAKSRWNVPTGTDVTAGWDSVKKFFEGPAPAAASVAAPAVKSIFEK